MTSHEQPNNAEQYQGPLGPAELIQFPEESGSAQLAESYTGPDTVIDWEVHNATNTRDKETAANRRAVIYAADGSAYYLRGNDVYDFSPAARSAQPIATFDEIHKAPELTIGEAAPFSRQAPITKVLIAVEPSQQDDPDAHAARPSDNNPFAVSDALLTQLKTLRQDQQRQRGAPRFAPPITVEGFTDESSQNPTYYDYTATHHDKLPGVTTKLPPGRFRDLDNTLPRAESRFGHAMSPRSGVSAPTLQAYRSEVEETAMEMAIEKAKDDYDKDVDKLSEVEKEEVKSNALEFKKWIMDNQDVMRDVMGWTDDRAAGKATTNRTKEYKPQVVEGIALDLRQKSSGVLRAMKDKVTERQEQRRAKKPRHRR